MFKLGFIGMGNMGSAILNGVSKLYNKDDIVFHSSTKKKMEKISEETGVKFLNNNEKIHVKSTISGIINYNRKRRYYYERIQSPDHADDPGWVRHQSRYIR